MAPPRCPSRRHSATGRFWRWNRRSRLKAAKFVNVDSIMADIPYIGSGPYCYANSLAMMLGQHSPALLEFATGSAFGMQVDNADLPFFDPCGWTPEIGVDTALRAVGWQATTHSGGDEESALARLTDALETAPVFVGPVEMGYLGYQPGAAGPIGADHYLVVLAADEHGVEVHDPQGYPYATLPLDAFVVAWRAASISYGEPFSMRTNFQQVCSVDEEEIISAGISTALRWLGDRGQPDISQGGRRNAAAAEYLARSIETGCSDDLRDHLIHFALRVGARRAADASAILSRAGFLEAAHIMREQARAIGSLQYLLMAGQWRDAAARLRELAPTYTRLHAALVG
ncbi:hypothetical protein M2272_002030 [Mycobacterium frederiksbergense]|uniref:Peptidase C39-like domain-containing protein n=1 Tax=Mycolicibacterium frederiksbergense TaxID=117567 RepID=A0ABT6KXG3_9MYCO|nr:hypothetical protein [Mycolicibacterium frederiksbergense]MDH6195390.1 hypothetical protein [Mycolicibacterium frederiksbergense]